MKTSLSKSLYLYFGLIVGLCLLMLGGPADLPAQTKTAPKSEKEVAADKEIHITADKLETFNDKNLAVFSGNVHATQADTVINCDRLDIYYDRREKPPEATAKPKKNDPVSTQNEDEKGSVKRVVAVGNVKIRSGERVATGDQAEYVSETGVVVLTGENSRVNSGNNFVTGNKITMYRNEDRVVVESGEKKRVEAVVYSGDQKLMQ